LRFTNCHNSDFIEYPEVWIWNSTRDYCGIESNDLLAVVVRRPCPKLLCYFYFNL